MKTTHYSGFRYKTQFSGILQNGRGWRSESLCCLAKKALKDPKGLFYVNSGVEGYFSTSRLQLMRYRYPKESSGTATFS